MRNDFFCFGDPDDAAKNIRFYDNGTTPLPTAKVGSNTERNFSGAVLYSNPSTALANWIHQTVTYDSMTKVLCLYIDGKRVNRLTGITVTIDPKQVAVSWNGRTGSSAVYSSTGRFDDLRILAGAAAKYGYEKVFYADPHGGENCFSCADLYDHSLIIIGGEIGRAHV